MEAKKQYVEKAQRKISELWDKKIKIIITHFFFYLIFFYSMAETSFHTNINKTEMKINLSYFI